MSNSPTVEKGCCHVRANVDAAIEKNNHVTIVAFLLELGICTGVDNCGAFTDNAFGKSGVDVRGDGRGTFRLSFDAPFGRRIQKRTLVLAFSRLARSIFCSAP